MSTRISVCVALGLRGELCAAAVYASASAKQVSQLVGFLVHVLCAVHLGTLFRAPFSGLLGYVAYCRRSGSRRYSYLRVRDDCVLLQCVCLLQ